MAASAKARGRRLAKREAEVRGIEELKANLNRLSIQVRSEILVNAVDEGSDEAHSRMLALAPLAPGSGTRGYHGADRLINVEGTKTRDGRERNVGLGPEAWFLVFQELGTIHHPKQPFIRPVKRAMKRRWLVIVKEHYDRAVRRSLR